MRRASAVRARVRGARGARARNDSRPGSRASARGPTDRRAESSTQSIAANQDAPPALVAARADADEA